MKRKPKWRGSKVVSFLSIAACFNFACMQSVLCLRSLALLVLLKAFYCKMKLPPLTVTKRPVRYKSTSVVHRGMGTTSDESVSRHDCNEPDFSNSEDTTEMEAGVETPMYFPDSPVTNEPTDHELQFKSDVKGWEQLRGRFLSVATEYCPMPLGAVHCAYFVQVLQNSIVKSAAPSSSATIVSSVTMRRSTSFMLLKMGGTVCIHKKYNEKRGNSSYIYISRQIWEHSGSES